MRVFVSLALALALVLCPALNGQTQQSAPTNAPQRSAETPKVVYDAHKAELPNHVFVVESDAGTYRPLGLSVGENTPLQARADLDEMGKLLSVIGAGRIGVGGGGTDIGPMMREGVIGAGLDSKNEHYFDIHHTQADTIDKIDPNDLAFCVATLAVMAYAVAEAPRALNTPTPARSIN